jgi:3-oxoacyl-[acyl-carrier-protein] synthase II
MAEGAAMLLLEEWDHAEARHARIYGEILSHASTNDASHMTQPRPDGVQAARCMSLAITRAGLTPADIGYVNAHGSSTPLNDSTETLALKQVFGDNAYRLPISATKGFHGHALGATGAWEAAISLLALHDHWLPPTLNLENPDPACDLHYLPGTEGRDESVNYILSNSFGFGGINACLVFGRA